MSPLDRLKWLAAIVGYDGIRGGAAVRTATVLAQHCNQITGTARPSVQTIANMAGITRRAVRTGLAELENAGFLSITRSTGGASSFTNEYLLVNGVNSASGVNDSTGVNSALGVNPSSVTPEPQFRDPLNSSSPEQGIEQGKNKISASGDAVSSKASRSQKFTPPSADQVAKYVATREIKIDPQAFVDFYDATNWMRGRTKIKDWKACVRTWENKQRQTTQQQPKAPARKSADEVLTEQGY